LQGNWEAFGALMDRNHRLVHDMMAYCCFEDGAGWANKLLIEAALAHDALGAKLTGAGGGGAVFALTHPGQEEQIVQIWRQTAAVAGLTSAAAYRLRIARRRLIVEVD
jgi:galactokinase